MKRAARYFDRKLIKQISKLPPSVRPFMLFMTLLGQPPITVGLVAGLVGYGLAISNYAFIYAGSVAIITVAITSLLKIFVRRDRPDNDYVKSMLIQTFSFPSGHAAGSLVCFGAFAYVAMIDWPALAVPFILTTLFLTFFIGISRIYLGAHYPSDVLGGWFVGGLGLIAIVLTESIL